MGVTFLTRSFMGVFVTGCIIWTGAAHAEPVLARSGLKAGWNAHTLGEAVLGCTLAIVNRGIADAGRHGPEFLADVGAPSLEAPASAESFVRQLAYIGGLSALAEADGDKTERNLSVAAKLVEVGWTTCACAIVNAARRTPLGDFGSHIYQDVGLQLTAVECSTRALERAAGSTNSLEN
ncbi:MAG: hypothetical protein LT103_13420 [Burkholderiaceae bacterium]|nr:hypothetical protein [Burkholderiaceae bacterium]